MLRRLHFDLWYWFHPPWDSGISPPELYEYISAHPAGRALDLGCGSGTNVVTLAQNGWRVTGLDYSKRAIHIARRKVQNAGVTATLLVHDVTQMNRISDKFDLALDLGCFHGICARAEYLSGLARLLLPGGHWLLYGLWNEMSTRSGLGLDGSDLNLIESNGFNMVSQRIGIDKRKRTSVWLLYQRAADAI